MSAAEYGYVNGLFLPGRGYLKVTVTPDSTNIKYIKSYLTAEENANHKNGEVADSYSVKSYFASSDQGNEIPSSLRLDQNFPNPFHLLTTISYTLPAACQVQVELLNIDGRQVAILADKCQQSGNHKLLIDSLKLSLVPGIYYCRLTTGKYTQTIKMICIA